MPDYLGSSIIVLVLPDRNSRNGVAGYSQCVAGVVALRVFSEERNVHQGVKRVKKVGKLEQLGFAR
jgi:hypothetical protein